MATMMIGDIPQGWQRAMRRAQREHLKPTRRVDGSYRVRSVSMPGTQHIVTLDPTGCIGSCSGCPGWEHGGRSQPCKHAGAVALALLFVKGYHLAGGRALPSPVIESACRGRSQLLREEE